MNWALPAVAVLVGVWALIRSSDHFVQGASGIATWYKLSPLVIGIVIVGFGTSAPEMVVSASSALKGNPALALGNAYGSNIANIGLILGITALIIPIQVHSSLLRKELPLLTLVTLVSFAILYNLQLSRLDGVILLIVFALVMTLTIWMSLKNPNDEMLKTLSEELPVGAVSLKKALLQLVAGLVLLILSSKAVVWGAVELATLAGISELVIGLTVVAVGTSLPELASTLAAVRKGEHDMAIGNVVGSNLFNTLAVVGIASCISPFALDKEVLTRDFPVMGLLTLSLFLIGWGRRGRGGRINRFEGGVLLTCFVAYTLWLLRSIF
ncbi:MAG: calcium/sodium antiporter [Kiritimatiellia bacterium]